MMKDRCDAFPLLDFSKITTAEIMHKGFLSLARGLTVEVLLKTEAVKGFTPHALTGLEDLDITQFVIRKGFHWLKLNCVTALHIGVQRSSSTIDDLLETYRYYKWLGSNITLISQITKDKILIDALFRILYGTKRAREGGLYYLASYMGLLRGILCRRPLIKPT